MKPSPFTYHRPATVVEAARLLAELGDGAKVLAGGQSLVPLLNFRLAAPEHLVDVNRIPGLDTITVGVDVVEVGATVRHARLLADATVAAAHPLLVEATGWIAHGVIRNRGTVCGSLAHGDPAAELPALLALLDGQVTAVRWDGGGLARRRVAAADLFVGPLMTSLAPDELLVAATFPRLAAHTGGAVGELARRHGDYAVAGVMLTVTVDDDGTPVDGRAAYLSCAPVPQVVELGPAVADPAALADVVATALAPTADIHASAEYRRHLAVTLTQRAVVTATARARTTPSPPPTPCPSPSGGSSARHGVHWRPQKGEGEVALTVNGAARSARVPARRLLSDVLRHDLRLTGTHVGCEHGVCGACTVLVDDVPVRSCLTFAVTVDGSAVTTVEGLAGPDGELDAVQRAFKECHGLQCGFCTPGFLLLTRDLLSTNPHPDDDEITEALGGNLCRCTGYTNIVRSVRRAAELLAGEAS